MFRFFRNHSLDHGIFTFTTDFIQNPMILVLIQTLNTMKNVEYMVLGPTVISTTKIPNVGVAPPVKLAIFIFIGINSSFLLPNFKNIISTMIWNTLLYCT